MGVRPVRTTEAEALPTDGAAHGALQNGSELRSRSFPMGRAWPVAPGGSSFPRNGGGGVGAGFPGRAHKAPGTPSGF